MTSFQMKIVYGIVIKFGRMSSRIFRGKERLEKLILFLKS